jgi:hypothetical protein
MQWEFHLLEKQNGWNKLIYHQRVYVHGSRKIAVPDERNATGQLKESI